MKRRGFVLLTALWLITAISAVGALALALGRVGAAVSRNRILLLRAGWAREACAEILLARYGERSTLADLGPVDLGRGTWCRAGVEDAGGKLDVNQAPRDLLLGLLGSDSLTDALLDWRDPDDAPRESGAEADWYRSQGRRVPRNGPLAAIEELDLVRGFDSAKVSRLTALVTVRGADLVDVNAAPAGVLAVLPGFGAEAVSLVLRRREARQPIGGMDELMSGLSPPARDSLVSRYQELGRYAGFAPRRVILRVEGGVARSGLASAARLTVVPVSDRLAVIRREVE